MEKEKHILKGMTEYVQKFYKKWTEDNNPDCQSTGRYILGTKALSDFLLQKLEIWMFIPVKLVDGVWVVLEEPEREYYDSMIGWNCPEDAENYYEKLKEYQEAKERVLFEGLREQKERWHQNKRTFYYIADKRILTKTEYFNGEIEIYFDLKDAFKIIEDIIPLGFILTESTAKKLGL